METEEHQKQTDARLDKIEEKIFQGTFLEKYQSIERRKHENPPKKESKAD